MRAKHLSYKRAIQTCLQNQHLIGAPFAPADPAGGSIARVLIAPYNRILQWQFLCNVLAGADPDIALSICRDGKYEVIVVSGNYKLDDVHHRPKTLGVYLSEMPGSGLCQLTQQTLRASQGHGQGQAH